MDNKSIFAAFVHAYSSRSFRCITLGKADRTAHKVAKAGVAAREELEEIAKQIDALKRQLVKTTKRLKRALA